MDQNETGAIVDPLISWPVGKSAAESRGDMGRDTVSGGWWQPRVAGGGVAVIIDSVLDAVIDPALDSVIHLVLFEACP